MNDKTNLKDKLLESISSVLPITLIVIAICKPLRESLHRKFFL